MHNTSSKQVFYTVVETFAAGQKPSYADLSAAFNSALAELNRISKSGIELSTWMGQITCAHIEGNAAALAR